MTNILTQIIKTINNKKYIQPFIITSKNKNKFYESIKLIAKYILCIKCLKDKCIIQNLCLSCKKFNYDQHPDYYEIISNENNIIQLNQIKKMLNFLQFKPVISKYKIIVINSINNMNAKACNSMLKTLEEPKNNILFLIIAQNKNINKTILERCYVIDIKEKNIHKTTFTKLNILKKYLLDTQCNYTDKLYINFFYKMEKTEQLNMLYFVLSSLMINENNKRKQMYLFKLTTTLNYYKFLLKENYSLDIRLITNLIKINLKY